MEIFTSTETIGKGSRYHNKGKEGVRTRTVLRIYKIIIIRIDIEEHIEL